MLNLYGQISGNIQDFLSLVMTGGYPKTVKKQLFASVMPIFITEWTEEGANDNVFLHFRT